jgi:uncharacterized protein
VTAVARVAEVWRYPVKSLQGERVDSSSVDQRGLAFDRAYALMDAVTGKVTSAKRPRQWPALLHLHARVADDESRRAGVPVVEVSFGGETIVITGADDAAAARKIGEWVGREVRIVSAAPEAAAFEEVWLEDMGSAESMYPPVTGEDEEGLSVLSVPAALGAPRGTLFDFASLHVLAAGSIRSLSRAVGDPSVDVRRCRPNLLVEAEDGDYPDNACSGSTRRADRTAEPRRGSSGQFGAPSVSLEPDADPELLVGGAGLGPCRRPPGRDPTAVPGVCGYARRVKLIDGLGQAGRWSGSRR